MRLIYWNSFDCWCLSFCGWNDCSYLLFYYSMNREIVWCRGPLVSTRKHRVDVDLTCFLKYVVKFIICITKVGDQLWTGNRTVKRVDLDRTLWNGLMCVKMRFWSAMMEWEMNKVFNVIIICEHLSDSPAFALEIILIL